jgi:hypothetical protein
MSGQELSWIIIAVLAVIVVAVMLRFFMGIAVEFLRVLLVVGILLVVGLLLWLLFLR